MENMVGKKRGRKPIDDKRDHSTCLSLRDDEYSMIKDLSNMLGMNMTDTIMYAVRWVYNIVSFRGKK